MKDLDRLARITIKKDCMSFDNLNKKMGYV
jgi:hypothetical protein